MGRFRERLRNDIAWGYMRLISLLLTSWIDPGTKRLIAFLTPGYDWRNGGILSIASLYAESARLTAVHRAQVKLCSVPTEPRILKYTWFKNRNYILSLEEVLQRCRKLEYLLLHIPEYATSTVGSWLARTESQFVGRIRDLHLNVLVQNVRQLDTSQLDGLHRFGRVTCTTAHQAYSTKHWRDAFGVPLHLLSTCVSPEQYSRRAYPSKESLLVVSRDEHPYKSRVLALIAAEIPELRVEIIHNIRYEQYKRILSRAKWALTLGEGLDGYFVESNFSGAVPFAVFNEEFFTPPFAALETVYPTWDVLLTNIVRDLKRLDNRPAFERCWQQTYDLLAELYQIENYRENLRRFYVGDYTFP